MAYDRKYGKVTIERGTIGDDEPVFLIRSRDRAAPAAIRAYAIAAERAGADEAMVAEVRAAAVVVAEWQCEHPDLVRVPTVKPGQIRDA